MKSVRSLRLLSALSFAVGGPLAHAFDYGANVYFNGGAGTWDTVNAEWTTDVSLTTGFQAWANNVALNAKFAGPASTIAISNPITYGTLVFNADGYTLTGGTLTAVNMNWVEANVGTTTIQSAFIGSSFRKLGAGTLVLQGANTYNGVTDIYGGTLILNNGGSITNTVDGTARVRLFDPTAALRVEDGTITAYGIQSEQGSITVTGSSSVMNLQNIQLGNGGIKPVDATLVISDGGTVTSGSATIGQNGNSSVTIGGAGSALNVSGTIWIGGTAGTTASVTQTGGTVTAGGGLQLGSSGGGSSSYHLEGGTLISGGGIGSYTNGAFEFAGGTLKTTGALAGMNGATTRVDTTSTLDTAADTTLQMNNSGTLSGAGSLIKTGLGTLMLSGANTSFSGGLNLHQGRLGVGHDSALGTGAFIVTGNATLQPYGVNGTRTIANAVTLNSGVTLTLNPIPETFYSSSALHLSGNIDGAGGLNLASPYSSAGVATLSGDNTFSGGTTLSAGILAVGSATALGTGNVTFAGNSHLRASGTQTIANDVVINNGVTASLSGAGALTLNGAISGDGSIAVTSTGITTLGGNNQDFTGAITIGNGFNDAILRATHANALGSTESGTTLNWFTTLILDNAAIGAESLTLVGEGANGTAGALIGEGVSSFAGDITLAGMTTFAGSGHLTLSGDITETYVNTEFTKTGTGTLVLSGNNNVSGFVFIDEGALTLSGANAIDATSGYAMYLADGAALQLQGGISVERYLSFHGTGEESTATLRNLSGNNTWGGTIDFTGNGAIQSDAGTLTLSGFLVAYDGTVTFGGEGNTLLSGYLYEGNLTKTGPGKLTLTNQNDYTGVTTISGGTLEIADGGSISDTSAIVNDATLAVNRTTAFSLDQTISGSGQLIKSGTGTLTLNVANTFSGGTTINGGLISFTDANRFGSGNLTLDGGGLLWGPSTTTDLSDRFNAIGDGGATFNLGSNNVTFATALTGTGGLTKAGPGTLTLNAANSYTGSTTVSAGTLTFGTHGTLDPSAALNVTGGTLNLAAKNMTTGPVTLSSGTISNGTLTASSYTAQNGTLSALIAGNGAFAKTGSGTVTLSGNNSSYSGNVTVSEGTLSVTTSANALGTGALTLAGGTLLLLGNSGLAFNRDTTVAGDATINVNRISSNGAVTHTFGTLSMGAHTLALTRGATGTGTGGITFGATTLTGDATFTPGSNTQLTLGSVTGNDTDLTMNGAGNLTISGALTLGAGGLVKSGAGSLTLTGTTSYGATTLNGGTFTLGANADLGSGAVTINAGTLSYNKAAGLGTRDIALNGGTLAFTAAGGAGTGTFILNGGILQWSGSNTLDVSGRLGAIGSGGATFDTGANSVAFGSALTGTGGITKAGSGTLTFSSANSYTGSTTVNAGTLALSGAANLGDSAAALTVSGGTLNLGASSQTVGNVTLVSGTISNGTLTGSAYDVRSGTLSASLGSSGAALIKTTSGTVTLSGTNLYSGGTHVTGGLLNFASGASLGSGVITLDGGGLQWASGNTHDISNRLAAIGTSGATFNIGGNTVVFETALSGTGGITKAGNGTLELASGNSYSGTTTVSAGTLRTASLGGGNIGLAGGTLQIVSDSAISSTAGVVVTGNSTLSFDRATSGGGSAHTFDALTIGDRTLTIAKTANVTDNATSVSFGATTINGTTATFAPATGTSLTLASVAGGNNGLTFAGAGNMTITGNLTNVGDLTANGTGTLRLLSTASTFTGFVNIYSGVLEVASLANLSTASSLGAPTNAAVAEIYMGSGAATGTLRYLGESNSTTNRGLHLYGSTGGAVLDASGTGTVTFTGAITSASGNKTLTLTGTNTGFNTIGSTIPNNSVNSRTSLTKSGTGTWVLSGANTYTGATAINAGTLFVNGSLANTTVAVADGATLGGSGSIGGATTLQHGARLAPGAFGSTGTLTFSNNLTLVGGAILDFQLGSIGDLIRVSAGTLSGPASGLITLNLSDAGGFDPLTGGTFTLFNFSGATLADFDTSDFTFGTLFAGTALGGYSLQLDLDARTLSVSYNASAIPEPSTYALLAGVVVLGLTLRRRRRQ